MEREIYVITIHGGAALAASCLWWNSPVFREVVPFVLAAEGVALFKLQEMCLKKAYKTSSGTISVLGISLLTYGIIQLTDQVKRVQAFCGSWDLFEVPSLLRSIFSTGEISRYGVEISCISYRILGGENSSQQEWIDRRISQEGVWALWSLANTSSGMDLAWLIDNWTQIEGDKKTNLRYFLAQSKYTKIQLRDLILRFTEEDLPLSWLTEELSECNQKNIIEELFREGIEKQNIVKTFDINQFESSLKALEETKDPEEIKRVGLNKKIKEIRDAIAFIKVLTVRIEGASDLVINACSEFKQNSEEGKEKHQAIVDWLKGDAVGLGTRLEKLAVSAKSLESNDSQDSDDAISVLYSFWRVETIPGWKGVLGINEISDAEARLKALGLETVSDLRRAGIWNKSINGPDALEALKSYIGKKEPPNAFKFLGLLRKKETYTMGLSTLASGVGSATYLMVWAIINLRAALTAPFSFSTGAALSVALKFSRLNEAVISHHLQRVSSGIGLIGLFFREFFVAVSNIREQTRHLGGDSLIDRVQGFNRETIRHRLAYLYLGMTLGDVCEWGCFSLDSYEEIFPGHFALGYEFANIGTATALHVGRLASVWVS